MSKRPAAGRYRADNSGGYGNPPVDGQFKTGGPGGPGRPGGSTSMDAALKKVFSGKVPYKENGKPTEGPATEALSKRLLQHGLAGPHRATIAVMEFAQKFGPQEADEPEAVEFNFENFDSDELRLFGRLMAKLSGDPDWERRYENDHPLAYLHDPDDPRNYTFEQTIEGVRYRRSLRSEFPDELLDIDNRAYWSAALPRRAGCFRSG